MSRSFSIQMRLIKYATLGLLDMTSYLVRLGANVQGPREWCAPYYRNAPVIVACERGHVAVVEFLLEQGADPKVTIAAAATWGQKELVQRLLDKGIPPVKALSKAVAGGYLDIVRLLLDAGMDVNESTGSESPLASAIALEYTALFNYLLEQGADLKSTGTAEEYVQRAKKDGLETMLLLVKEHGVDVEDYP